MNIKPASAAVFSVLLVAATLALFYPISARSYLPEFTVPGGGSTPQPDHWDFSAFPVTWNLNPAHGTNIQGSHSVAEVMQAAFNTWTGAPNASLQIARGGDSTLNVESQSPSNINLICFVCSDADFSKESSTLALTITTTATAAGQSDGHGGTTRFAGQIIKADILFNPNSSYSTDGGSGQDLQTVAIHEIGHFLGLDHSAVVRAVMFPFASSLQALSYDDVAGISVLYPKNPQDVATGAISGTVRFANSGGVFGAHVFAESVNGDLPFAGSIRKTPIGILTRPDGTFTIQGVPAGSYIVTAEPLDGPVANGDVSEYPAAFGRTSVQTSFTTRWH